MKFPRHQMVKSAKEETFINQNGSSNFLNSVLYQKAEAITDDYIPELKLGC